MAEQKAYLDYEGLDKVVQKILGKIDEVSSKIDFTPIGAILMWAGSEVPTGWVLCDGQNGTPDLRGKFILGSDNSHAIGSTGGNANGSITLSVDNLPAHTHTTSGVSITESTDGGSLFSGGENTISAGGSGVTGSTGSGNAIDIMPPYYALAYIMKVSSNSINDAIDSYVL